VSLKIPIAVAPPLAARAASSGPNWPTFLLGLLGTFLVGTATAMVIQLYVVPRVETRQRREDRWERNVIELGELLTTQVSDRAHEVRLEQSLFRFIRQKDMSGPEFDQAKVAQGVAERGRKAQQLTWDFMGLIRTRVYWLSERIWARMPDVIETRKFQGASMLYLMRVEKIAGWSKDDDSTDDAFEEMWEKERTARYELVTQVKNLADMQHFPRASWFRAGKAWHDLLGGPDSM
jgi:hypothetical protein